MRLPWIWPCVALLWGCGGQPQEVPEPPRVTKRAKPASAKKAAKSAKKKSSSFGFGEDDEKSEAKKKTIDRKRRMSPSMDELEGAMRWQNEEPASKKKFICESCGTESPLAGTCCGRDRIPLK